MEAFNFEKSKVNDFPNGTFLIILAGATPVDGIVLSRFKVIVGWPNPILTTPQGLQDPPNEFLEAVHKFLQVNWVNRCSIPVFAQNFEQKLGQVKYLRTCSNF